MGVNISFDVEKLIGRLNLLEKSLIPQARHRALHDLGQYLRKFHAREMESVFNEPRKYTTSSVLYKVQGDTLTLFIRDDSRQSPARYLEPQTMSPGQYLKSALVGGVQRVMTVTTTKYWVSRSFHALEDSLIKNDCTGMD